MTRAYDAFEGAEDCVDEEKKDFRARVMFVYTIPPAKEQSWRLHDLICGRRECDHPLLAIEDSANDLSNFPLTQNNVHINFTTFS
jgi:hypothetical protein